MYIYIHTQTDILVLIFDTINTHRIVCTNTNRYELHFERTVFFTIQSQAESLVTL